MRTVISALLTTVVGCYGWVGLTRIVLPIRSPVLLYSPRGVVEVSLALQLVPTRSQLWPKSGRYFSLDSCVLLYFASPVLWGPVVAR